MKTVIALITVLAVLTMSMVGCTPASTSSEPPDISGIKSAAAGIEGNFRFLISDEANAIEDFQHLYVTISKIALHKASDNASDNESSEWCILEAVSDPDSDNVTGLDLRPLTGANAVVLWNGNITAGTYDKAFIYVSNVTGILVNGDTAEVKLPSDKLQVSKPFDVGTETVNFVYDITVVKAGNSGKYNLKPQIAESGADKDFIITSPKKNTEKYEELNKEQHGKP